MAGKQSKEELERQQKEEEEKKIVSCIVKFRPCEDWRGEYGFDWFREGEEDYKERYDRGLDFGFTHEDAMRKKMGRRKYEKWKKKERERILKEKKENPALDVEKEWHRTMAKEALSKGINSDYDPHEWKKHAFEKDQKNQIKEEYVAADDPMEYLYNPESVELVTYSVNRKEFGNVWVTSDFRYEDMANGVMEAQTAIETMKSFVNIKDGKYSLIGDEGSSKFEYPIYHDLYDGQYSDLEYRGNTVKFVSYEDQQDGLIHEMYLWTDGPKYVLYFVHAKEQPRHCILLKDNQWFVTPLPKTPEDPKYGDVIMEKLYTHVAEDGLNNFWWIMENVIVNDSRWKNLNSLSLEDGKNEYAQIIQNHITANIRNNKDVDIMHLIQNDQLDDIMVTVYFPRSLIKQELTEQMGMTCDEKGRYKWQDHLIKTWKEDYRETFSSLDIHKKGEEDAPKYCVPTLALNEKSHPCTRFKVRNYHDAPAKAPMPWNEARVQLLIDGDCQKLVFKPNVKGLLEWTPSEFSNPSAKETLTIKYKDADDLIGAKLFLDAYSENEGEPQKLVGRLQVCIWNEGTLPINVIKVSKEGGVFESSFSEAIEDQLDFANNLFSQAGIKINRKDYNLTIDKKLARKIMPHGNWSDEVVDGKTYSEEQLLKGFKEKLAGTQFPQTTFNHIKVFFVDCNFIDNGSVVGGYSSVDNPGTILIFKASFQGRSELGIITHELMHAIKFSHHFQRIAMHNEPYCFSMGKTTNVMDYFGLSYSLHRYQWLKMQQEVKARNRIDK